MIENPIYGGAYAYGKTAVAAGYDVAGVCVKIRRKPRSDWLALMPNAHAGYVSWEKAETIRKMVSSNVPTSRHHGAPKHGDALLAGLLRCRRCGRKLTLRYSGAKHHIPRYSCSRGWMDNGEPRCIAFGGLRVDDAIEDALLTVVGPGAIAAAVSAEKETNDINAGAKLRQPAGVKLHHAGAHCWGGICGMAGGFARSRERSSPRAAQRRAAGAGLDGESAHRAIISDAAMRVLYYADELAFWASGGSRSVDRRIGS